MVALPADTSRTSLRWAQAFAALAIGLTLVRVVGLTLTPLDLHGDEAQYWVWSQSLDWGYFSKPPLIAWTIALTTSVFGDAEWAVRLAAPIAHGLGAWALFALARRMYGETAGFWAGAGWLTMPGVWLSSAVISTDALLLPLWSGALLALWRLRETRGWGDALGLGAALGLGFLAKYAMGYFALGMALAALVDGQTRRAMLSRQGLAALALAAAIVAPNLIWNAAHDFATIGHTAANANLDAGARFSANEILQFVLDQLAVFGPIAVLALIAALWRGRAAAFDDPRTRFLLMFALPPLAIILVQATLSRAHGNWAASAYPALTVLFAGLAASQAAAGRPALIAGATAAGALALGAVAALLQQDALLVIAGAVLAVAVTTLAWTAGRAGPAVSTGLHGLVGAVFLTAALHPPAADAVGLADAFKRSRNWEETANAIAARAALGGSGAGGFTSVMVDNRLLYNDLAYYWRDGAPAPLRMWLFGAAAENHAEATAPMNASVDDRVLIVGATPGYEAAIAGDFREVGPITRIEIDLGGGEVRRLSFREGSGFAPAPRGP